MTREIIFRGKRIDFGGLIITSKGKKLTNMEIRFYINKCVKDGYKSLYECPEFEDVEHIMNEQ